MQPSTPVEVGGHWRLQRPGGVAALLASAAFVVGFALFLTVLSDASYGSDAVPATEHAAFLADHLALMAAWNLVIYVAFGVFLVVLVLALHERLQVHDAGTVSVATAFGLIWAGLVIASGMIANVGAEVIGDLHARDAQASGQAWLTLDAVVRGIGGGVEVVGGLWLALVSWAALRSRGLPRAAGILGLLAGTAALFTVIPPLSDLGAVFGLGSIVWFAWVGVALLRRPSPAGVPGVPVG